MNESDGRQNCNPEKIGNFETSEYTIGWAEALICRTNQNRPANKNRIRGAKTHLTGRPAEAA